MNLSWIDLTIVVVYLVAVAMIGFLIRKKASSGLDNYFLAGRNLPWWVLGIAGCSSYIDIAGIMALVGALFYLGLKSVWMTNIFWGWFMMAGYMAFQAKWIRRSGVMSFAEWNETRFGKDRDAEMARLASAIFLLVLMIFNLMYMAVGIGKFAEDFFPLTRWQSTLIVFGVVGIYVTLGGFYGVVITDILQTALIAIGAIVMIIMVFAGGIGADLAATRPEGWSSLGLSWHLWPGYLESTPAAYQHFNLFGPLMIIGFTWMMFRVLAGPNVWDFQFFLTTKTPRDAAMAGGMWTAMFILRWIIAIAFLLFGISILGSATTDIDGEKILPLVISRLPVGLSGLFLAVMLAALMSTLDAMINVTANVVTNDFLKRYFFKNWAEKKIIRVGQLASIVALMVGFVFSLAFDNVISAWETMIFVVVTMILVPATMRWHWWRFSAKAFVWSMAATAVFIVVQKMAFGTISGTNSLGINIIASLIITIAIGFIVKPTDKQILVKFYSRIKPFGFWGPIRKEAVRQGLMKAGDKEPMWDAINGLIAPVFQFIIALIPFYMFLRKWPQFWLAALALAVVTVVLYFTWYKNLPSKDEK
jgi:SSS family solute:Na+ symporter